MCSSRCKLAFDNVTDCTKNTQQNFSLSIFSCEWIQFQRNSYMAKSVVPKECVHHMLKSTEMAALRT